MLAHRVRSIYAMPVVVAGQYVGALDLFMAQPQTLRPEQVAGIAVAAELAQMPVLDLLGEDMHAAANDPNSDAWTELAALTRSEVSQATGMVMAQLGLDPASALARLRAHAYATGRRATEVARDIIDRHLRLEGH